MQEQLRVQISDLFSAFDYLLDSIGVYDTRKFKAIINCNQAYTPCSLYFLSELLRRHHNSPCIVLIDEYDAPLNYAYQRSSEDHNHTFFYEAKIYFDNMFSQLLKVQCEHFNQR
jgi:hypothetical protein